MYGTLEARNLYGPTGMSCLEPQYGTPSKTTYLTRLWCKSYALQTAGGITLITQMALYLS